MGANVIAILWAVFAAMFSVVGLLHVRQSRERVARMELPPAGASGDDDVDRYVRGLRYPVNLLAGEVNRFVDNFNKSNRRMNLVESLGYLAAALTALVSELVELKVFGG